MMPFYFLLDDQHSSTYDAIANDDERVIRLVDYYQQIIQFNKFSCINRIIETIKLIAYCSLCNIKFVLEL